VATFSASLMSITFMNTFVPFFIFNFPLDLLLIGYSELSVVLRRFRAGSSASVKSRSGFDTCVAFLTDS